MERQRLGYGGATRRSGKRWPEMDGLTFTLGGHTVTGKRFALSNGSVVYINGGGLTYFPVYNVPLPQYGLFITPVYAFALAYFMIKRGLFDAEELAQAAHRDKLTAIGVLAGTLNTAEPSANTGVVPRTRCTSQGPS